MQPAVKATSKQPTESNTTPANDPRWLFVAIAILAFAGMVVSAISLQRHYAKSTSSFCEFGEKFNCDVVNRSEYSTVMGIPVAGIGVAGYALLLALATLYRKQPQTPSRMLAASAAGLAFALYLTYVEGYVLETWCILCLSSLVTITGITLTAAVLKVRSQSSK
jgi:vitamin-K-epoxide reductase (warfarin-sensitive)